MVGTLSSGPQTFLRHYLQGPVEGAGVSGAAQSSSDAAAAAASPAVSSAPGACAAGHLVKVATLGPVDNICA